MNSLKPLIAIGLLSVGAITPAHADGRGGFDYVAGFVCGDNPGAPPRVLVGDYATSIAIHNASSAKARISARIALTFPPGGTAANPEIGLLEPTEVPGRSALSIDCDAIFGAAQAQAPYIQGVAIISSNRRLSVIRTQTASPDANPESAGAVASIDVDRIEASRRFRY